MRAWLHEPLVHFLLAGLVLFALYDALGPHGTGGNRIAVTHQQVEDMGRQFRATWHRDPSPTEWRAMLDSAVRDEILYREGVALGLDRDDPVIQRRVRQKLELVSEEEIGGTQPTDAELASFLREHPATFRLAPLISFEQAMLGEQVRSGMLPAAAERMPRDLIARDFGETFAAALETAAVGEWTAPIDSAYGQHRVRVLERIPARVPELAEVRGQVEREWEADRRKRAREEAYNRLRERYEVSVEAGTPPASGP